MARKENAEQRDAIALLMEDHKHVQELFKDFEKLDRTDEATLQEVVETAIMELQVHSMVEEELFYPAVRSQMNDDEGEDLLNEAEVEHEAADELIAKLQELEPGDEMYAAYFTVLTEYVRHHIKEEEKELFPKVKKLKELDLEQLGRELATRKQEIEAELESEQAEAEADEESGTGARSKSRTGTVSDVDEELEDQEEQAEPSKTRH